MGGELHNYHTGVSDIRGYDTGWQRTCQEKGETEKVDGKLYIYRMLIQKK